MSLEFLLNSPSPSGSPAPRAIKQEPETTTAAAIPVKREPSLVDEEVQRVKPEHIAAKEEDIAVKNETAAIKPEVKQEATVAQPPPTATCDFCPFTYQDWRQLWAHWAVHLGVHTTRCIVCGVRSSNNDMAKKHAVSKQHLDQLRRNGAGA
jgi:hypothetical protein